MQANRLTSSAHERGVSAVNGRWWETTYTAVSWEYPPSPAAYYDALLSRGASHSRFLRIAYLSTRERSNTAAPRSPTALFPTSTFGFLDTPTSLLTPADLTSPTSLVGSPRKPAVRLPSIPPCPVPRPCVYVRPRSANPTSLALKRRKSQWPKPPHYHASLLRSPLSRRKGLFRAVLPPNKAADFFRWDILLDANVSLSGPCRERDRTRTSVVDACASLFVAESVLEPYEAAAGFFGWHGLGLDIIRRVQGNFKQVIDNKHCWNEGIEVWGLKHDNVKRRRISDLQRVIDEAKVEEGRAKWAHAAEELVGPPGLALWWVVGDGESDEVTAPSHSVTNSCVPLSISSRLEEVRWDPAINYRPSRPSRPISAIGEKRQSPPLDSTATVLGPSSNSNPELGTNSPSAWWYGSSLHRAPPSTSHLPSLRFPPLPSVPYDPQSSQFSPWIPPGRVPSAQRNGCWYNAQPAGAPSSENRDSNPPKSLPPYPHILATPVTPTLTPTRSSRHPVEMDLGWNEHGLGHDYDRETETDHGYESATTTTDSDPPPHTPVGASMASHFVEALQVEELQVHGDDEVEVHGFDTDAEHAAACQVIGLSDTITSAKLNRFSMSTPSSVSSGSSGSNRNGYGFSKDAVVFPSLNEPFCDGSLSQMSFSSYGRETSVQTTPTKTVAPISSSSLPSAEQLTSQLGHDNGGNSKSKSDDGGVLGDNLVFVLDLCSPPQTSLGPGLRKDSQGFWEPVTPISPSSSSSSSSLPLSLSEGKMKSRPTAGWIGEKTGLVQGESSDLSEAASLQFTPSVKSRSLSPGPRRVTNAEFVCSSSLRPTSSSSPTPTPAFMSVFGSSYPSSPSPTNNSSSVPPNPATLLPAFLGTTTVKRKKGSKTREIVDRLRSTSIDAGRGGVGLGSFGWLASPGAGGELDSTLGKSSSVSDHDTRDHVTRGRPSPAPLSKPSPDSASWLGSDLGKKHHGQTLKSFDSSASVLSGKSQGATQVVVPSSETVTTTNLGITPFPILSVSHTPPSNLAITHQGWDGGATGYQPVTATQSNCADAIRVNATMATSPNARSSGPQLVPCTPNSGTSPPTYHFHHPLPSPSRSVIPPRSPLGPPPPILTVSPYPHPMHVPLTQYHLVPLHQVQQGQGTWLAVYPGRPPHLPMHPLPTQTHAPPITGMSGMRHVSW